MCRNGLLRALDGGDPNFLFIKRLLLLPLMFAGLLSFGGCRAVDGKGNDVPLDRLVEQLLPPGEPPPGPLVVGEILCKGRRSDLGDEVAAALPELLKRRAPGLTVLSRVDLERVLVAQRLQMGDLFLDGGVEPGRILPARTLLEGFLFPEPEGRGVRLRARVVDLETGAVLSAGGVRLVHGAPRLRFDTTELPLEVEYLVFARPWGGDAERVLREEDTLYSGDLIRVRLKPNRPAWLYLFLLDSQGDAHLLFPETPDGEARVAAGELLLPSSRTYWRLDPHPGRESLLVAASLNPIRGIADLLDELDAGAARLRSEAVLQRVRDAGRKGMAGISNPSAGVEGALDGVLRSYTGVIWKRFDFLHAP